MQVPLSSIKGTGPDGRIVKADIEDYIGILSLLYIFHLFDEKENNLPSRKLKEKKTISFCRWVNDHILICGRDSLINNVYVF
jgi:hypothetical protein